MTLTRHVRRLLEGRNSTVHYECGNCGRSFELNRQECTRCGSYRIERSNYDDLLAAD